MEYKNAAARADTTIRLDTDQSVSITGPILQSSALRRYRSIALRLAVTDALCLIAALLLAWVARFGFTVLPVGYFAVVLTGPIIWLAIFHGFGLYAPQHLAPAEEFRRTILASAIGLMTVMLGSFWFKSSFSRVWVGLTLVFVVLFESIVRRAWRRYQERLKTKGLLTYRTVIVGANDEARRLASTLSGESSGFAPIGYVATNGHRPVGGLPVLGDIRSLREVIREFAVECIFVCPTEVSDADMLLVTQASRYEGTEVRVNANLPQILSSRLAVQPLGPAMAISIKPVRLTGAQLSLKRATDIFVGALGVLLSLPAMVVIAIAIRLTSSGPIFFRQQRITKDGRVFTMFKFRTMVANADLMLEEGSVDVNAPFFKLRDDPRLTRVGAFIRRFSLDELPQFVNVVRGEMSLVGPRPLPAEQVHSNLHLLESPRHDVRAGITGWWQINGRSEISPGDALRMDVFYIENWSLTLDLYILFKTFSTTLGRKGAY